jgi:hypothetical protein
MNYKYARHVILILVHIKKWNLKLSTIIKSLLLNERNWRQPKIYNTLVHEWFDGLNVFERLYNFKCEMNNSKISLKSNFNFQETWEVSPARSWVAGEAFSLLAAIENKKVFVKSKLFYQVNIQSDSQKLTEKMSTSIWVWQT